MKKIVACIVAFGAVLTMSGCSNAETRIDTGISSLSSFTVPLKDGREVVCVVYAKGALSCDWEHAG